MCACVSEGVVWVWIGYVLYLFLFYARALANSRRKCRPPRRQSMNGYMCAWRF